MKIIKQIIVFLFFVFIFTLNCFANDYIISKECQDKFRNEIYKAIEKELPKTKNNINKEFVNAQKAYKKFLKEKNKSKNTDKYIFLIQDCQRGIESYETIFISILIDITNKYKDIKNYIPPTDFPGTLIDFIYPYLEANNIDYSKINELDSYSANKIKELDFMLENIN